MEEQNQSASGENQQKKKKEKNIGMAVLAYIIFFIPLLTDAKNDPFVKYHVKQGLILFIAGCITAAFSWVPPIHWFSGFLNIALLILFIVGILNALSGKEKPLPLIGKFSDNFKF
jgi:uncharacterized membrane protein